MNKMWLETMGYKRDEVIGHWFGEFVTSEYRNIFGERFPCFKALGKVCGLEFDMLRKDGTTFIASFEGRIGYDEHNNFKQTHCIFIDVTEREKARRELSELNKNLETLVKERTLKLKAVNAELEAFNYSVSHDLRAPIRSMDGFTKILLERNKDILDEQSLDYLNRARKGCLRMRDLVDSLLKLSRISRKNLVKRTFDLSKLAKTIFDELKSTNSDRDVEIIIEEGLVINADMGLLQIAIENLIDNAWKFTALTDNPKIEFGSNKSKDELVFFIKDNGCGFNMEYADKLFTPFQRLHYENEYSGLGIGLATVRRIINIHNGRIWAESEVDKGTTLYFELPET
ncbi:MAG: PAS domain S-box protein [Candidatus Omnitrophica bacterium]|nr:PAS domain S-box protein [Candidatus Omnitrophota bacterium]MBU1997169.1 PAS domain S-box protein [Candidatus Omnitrophota bacterium]